MRRQQDLQLDQRPWQQGWFGRTSHWVALCLMLGSGMLFAWAEPSLAGPVPSAGVMAAESEAPRTSAWVASPGLERPAGLADEVEFWVRIYSQVTSQGGLIHDERYLAVVYEQVEFAPKASAAERRRVVEAARARYATALRMLANRLRLTPASEPLDLAALTQDEVHVLELWPEGTAPDALTAAADRLRFQLGQRDRFLEGYVRAGAYEAHLREVMERLGLPGELAALPHVESSFNARAYSKVGAAGMWQFMPSTGRRWLQIDEVVDERRDPYKSTVAAAHFLQQNYRLLETWPLALTAWNHGPGGLRRAKREMGTADIAKLVKEYQGRAFGFASRNFFVCFLAALEVDRNAERYFGSVLRAPPDDSRVIVLPEYVPAQALARVFNVDSLQLRELNLPLLSPVWDGRRYVPRGYALRVPATARPTVAALHELRPQERFAGQAREPLYKVRRGDTLKSIANRFGTSSRWLLANNGLRNARQVKRGVVLRLPGLAAGPRAKGAYMVYAPPVGNVWLAGLPERAESAAAVVVAAAAAEEAAAISGEAAADAIEDVPEPMTEGPMIEGPLTDEPVLADTGTVTEAGADLSAELVTEAMETAATAEPLTAAAEEAAGPGLVPGGQPAASPDPADYSLGSDGSFTVQGSETLSQLARWLGTDLTRLRQWNGLKPRSALSMGRRLKVDPRGIDSGTFERERLIWHRAQQAAYFQQMRIVGIDRHQMRLGESLWSLTQRHAVPPWLLQQYNPDLDFAAVRVGTEIILPRVRVASVGGQE